MIWRVAFLKGAPFLQRGNSVIVAMARLKPQWRPPRTVLLGTLIQSGIVTAFLTEDMIIFMNH